MDAQETVAGESADDVFALFRAGQLLARYPTVKGLLATTPETERVRAGRLLARLDPDEVLRAHPGTPAVTVAVTGHGTLAPLVAPLTMELARHGLVLRPFVSNFDSYVFDLSSPTSALYASAADLTLCLLDPMVVFDELSACWEPTDVERVLNDKLALLDRLVARFESTSQGTLVLNTLPLSHAHLAQLVDYGARSALSALWRDANAHLLRLEQRYPRLVVLDLDPLLGEGVSVTDQRMSVYAKAHLSGPLLERYAREIGHLARHVAGRTRKCLVLDLDGTLWGGVLGEDGVAGIEVAETHRGEAFQHFQRVVRQIGSQGVLLAVVSKNDRALVREALRERRDMALREEDFTRIVASWRPKSEALRELADTLNIGLDSLVFVDDSPAENGLVRHELPEVAVVSVDGEPARHAERLLRDGWFATRGLTREDRARVARYRQEAERQDFLDSFASLEDYLRELRVRVRLADAAERDVPRLSQLSLRTNQFNLTTERLQPADVQRLLSDPGARILTVRSADRFGDNGMVGAVFMSLAEAGVRIDNFVLSCRVFSRGIEQACLAVILDRARAAGSRAVHARYRRSARNGLVEGFYPRYGFERVAFEEDTVDYRHSLAESVARPAHLCIDEDFGGFAP